MKQERLIYTNAILVASRIIPHNAFSFYFSSFRRGGREGEYRAGNWEPGNDTARHWKPGNDTAGHREPGMLKQERVICILQSTPTLDKTTIELKQNFNYESDYIYMYVIYTETDK